MNIEKSHNSKIKILVVEDDPDLREILSEHLEFLNFQVETAENGKEALVKISLNPPHYILSDMRMPDLNGLQLLNQLNSSQFNTIPVILMSGYFGELETHNFHQFKNFRGFIDKPLDLGRVFSLISD